MLNVSALIGNVFAGLDAVKSNHFQHYLGWPSSTSSSSSSWIGPSFISASKDFWTSSTRAGNEGSMRQDRITCATFSSSCRWPWKARKGKRGWGWDESALVSWCRRLLAAEGCGYANELIASESIHASAPTFYCNIKNKRETGSESCKWALPDRRNLWPQWSC